MKQIKTIRQPMQAAPTFDAEVNAALADGWQLTKRELLGPVPTQGPPINVYVVLYAELEREEITEAERCCENCRYWAQDSTQTAMPRLLRRLRQVGARNVRGQDLTGRRFGRLTVLEALPGDRRTRWRCICDCGRETVVGSGYHLTSGNTKSCGCFHRNSARDRHLIHGGKGSRLYNIWKNARQRCRNPKSPDFHLYGGRGVQFASAWDDFAEFKAWALANGYREDLTLDRLDPDGDYSPENCRWATWKEQRHNQRRCKEVMP